MKYIRTKSIKVLLLIYLCLTIILPLGAIFVQVANVNILKILTSKVIVRIFKNSITSTLIATTITVMLALVTAWFLSRSKIKYKKVWITLLTIPMLIPSISHGTGLVVLFGGNGVLTNFFNLNFNVYGLTGIVLGSIMYSFPVALLMLVDVFKYEDCSVYTSADVLGIPKLNQLLNITFPYLKKPLISVFFTVFTLIFTDYGVPLMVGGKFMTLPLYMYNEVIGLLDFGKGAVIGLILMIPAFIAFILDILSKDVKGMSFTTQEYILPKNKVRDVFSKMWIVIFSVLLLIPIFVFLFLMVMEKYPVNLSFSMRHIYRTLNMSMTDYMFNSIIIALFTSLFGTCLSYLVAYFSTRSIGKISKCLHLISMLTLAIPGIVLGLSYSLIFKSSFIYGTFVILIMVNIVHFFASPYLIACNALGKLNSNYENVAKTLGIKPFYLIKDVIIPQTIDTILEMFSYFFINAMVTISAVSFLTTIDNQPLAMMIPQLEGMMLLESISFVSIVILLINLFTKFVIYVIKKIINFTNNKKGVYKMELTHKEFDVLTFIEANLDKDFTQRELSHYCKVSLGTINNALQTLNEKGYINDQHKIVEKGYKALEPYRVKRAVFIAAGFGSRLVPLTINSPKPLIRVNGTRMIDTLLDAVIEAGIEEIYIVRGYLKEQFDQLLYKYPMIKFIDNEYYNEANNISSVLYARQLLQNAYVLEADLVLYNPKLITKYQYTSNYLGVKTELTDDWCFETNKNKVITKVKVGGRNVHHMYGISYWNKEDGEKLAEDVKNTFELPGGKERYWDQVPLEYCKEHYKIEVRECSFDDIIEIDSYNDLKKIDPHYQ